MASEFQLRGRIEIPQAWERVHAWIGAAAAHSADYTAADVQTALLDGAALLLESPRAAAVVQVMQNPARRVLFGWVLGGAAMNEWDADLTAELVKLARARGCAAITSCVRPGLARKLRAHGFEETHRTIERRVDE